MTATSELVCQLRHRIRRLESTCRPVGEGGLSCGWPPLDRLWPGGGLRRGTLVEWLGAGPGSGAAVLAAAAAREAAAEGGAIVVLDPARRCYPPALAAWGLDLNRVVFVHPPGRREEAWAWDQALRCPAVAVVWGWVEQLDARAFRRLQLSAEAGGGLGLLLRPSAARTQPTWADVRWWVEPQADAAGWRLRVELLHSRGAAGGGSVSLVLDEWTGRLREGSAGHATLSRSVAARVARAAALPRTTGTGGAAARAV